MYLPDGYDNTLKSNEVAYNNFGSYYSQQGYSLAQDNLECTSQMTQVSQVLMGGLFQHNEIRAIKFDPHEELLWAISVTGHLSGFYEWNLSKIVSVEVPEYRRRHNDEVYELLDVLPGVSPTERIIFVLGRKDLLIYKKTGTIQKKINIVSDDNLQCFSHHNSKSSSLILGTNKYLCELDIESEKKVSLVALSDEGAMSLLKYNRGILCGTMDGQIHTIDFRVPKGIQHSFKPHGNTLSDFTVNFEGYAVISCGTYNKQYYSDQFLKVYDLRYKKPQCPIKVEMLRPSFVRFLPGFNDTILVASNSGQFQVANFGENLLGRPSDEAMRMGEFDTIKSVDISSNSKLIAFGSRCGVISLTSNGSDELKFNNISHDTVFPNIPSYMSLDPVGFDDSNFIVSSSEFAPEPIDTSKFSKLSSDWPKELSSNTYKKINPVDMSLFSQYQAKFKVELIGRKPVNWGPVWFPY